MTTEADHDHWSGLSTRFEIHRVRLVAMLGRDGGAIVENLRRLYCSEGRIYVSEGTRQGDLHSLEYDFTFSASMDGEPQLATAVPGRIVISGHHTNGRRIEIRGTGLLGYDEAGNIEGRFDTLPAIMTEADRTSLDNLDETEPEQPASQAGFPLPPQFLQANRSARSGSARRRAVQAAHRRAKHTK